MSLPRTMPLLRSWAIVLFMIVFASVRISSAAKVTVENPDIKSEVDDKTIYYKIIVRKEPLELKCSIDEEGFSFIWRKRSMDKDKPTTFEEIKEGVTKNGKETTLKIAKPGDENAGRYECAVVPNNTEIAPGVFHVLSKPTGNLENDVIVIEGERLSLDCQPTGVPPPEISWVIGDNTLNVSTERIKLLPNKNNVTNAKLEIRDAKRTDRGEYKCVLINRATMLRTEEVTITSNVRVKDKLAALWPFLGICVEVFVLCAIIFIYEKKRNKTELDESDTDNSPEQKNTPDHGKDSVRQRK